MLQALQLGLQQGHYGRGRGRYEDATPPPAMGLRQMGGGGMGSGLVGPYIRRCLWRLGAVTTAAAESNWGQGRGLLLPQKQRHGRRMHAMMLFANVTVCLESEGPGSTARPWRRRKEQERHGETQRDTEGALDSSIGIPAVLSPAVNWGGEGDAAEHKGTGGGWATSLSS